jgi:hypothetical protein
MKLFKDENSAVVVVVVGFFIFAFKLYFLIGKRRIRTTNIYI